MAGVTGHFFIRRIRRRNKCAARIATRHLLNTTRPRLSPWQQRQNPPCSSQEKHCNRETCAYFLHFTSQKTLVKKTDLFLAPSLIKGAGTGLFTAVDIERGEQVIEYTGRITTWKEVQNLDFFNVYIMYVDKGHVIDASDSKDSLGRYANDARGLQRLAGLSNNCKYIRYGKRVFLESFKKISAGSEILVNYGKDYWDVVKDYQKEQDAKKQG